jgi:biopolymer transport protein ExbB
LHEIARLERNLWVLATVANIAPLFGFLGTVTGMIAAFEALAEVGLGNPRAVASGISQALITTATGLTIALPVQYAFNHYTNRVNSYSLDMETSAAVLLETFNELEEPEQEAQAL